jgi:cysteine-rich repeat protein
MPTPTSTPRFPTCGDGIVDRPGEECDDGNLANGDDCSSTCKIPPGVYCTYSQGGWGQTCKDANPGCVRDAGFAAALPAGLRIGDAGGPNGPAGGFTARWTSSAAIEAFLPTGGSASPLAADLTNPTSTPAGQLAGQLVGVKLDLAIAGTPASLRLLGCVVPALRDLTIDDLVLLADDALATGATPAGVTFADLANALAAVNLNFDNCTANTHCLAED